MEERKHFNWSDYDLFCILRFLLRNCWLIVVAALIAVMGAFLIETFVLTPQYTSTTTFSVTSRSSISGAGTIAATDTLAGQFGEVLQSDIVRQAAAKRMGLDSFPAAIDVTVPTGTNIIQMSISAESPELAYKSALAIIDCHSEYTAMVFTSAGRHQRPCAAGHVVQSGLADTASAALCAGRRSRDDRSACVPCDPGRHRADPERRQASDRRQAAGRDLS